MAAINQRLAAIFQEMADILLILGDEGFRANSFSRAARVLADLPEDVAGIGPDLKRLTEFEGIGKGAAERIIQFLQTGRIQDHQDLLARIPAGLLGLLALPGVGPKTVALLWKHAGIDSLEGLKAKLAGDELAALPGFGKKKLENLRKSVAFTQTAAGRVSIGQAMPLACHLVSQVSQWPGVKGCAFAGSVRRGRETIGDVDLLVAADDADAAAVSAAFAKLDLVEQVLAQGPTRTSVRTGDGLQVDLRIVPPASYGAALMYFTGSKEHNVALRERAGRRGLKLNEYGLFQGDRSIAGRSEQEVFEALGLAWIPPELREDRGEIALAEGNALPALVELVDIRAELHAHTTASDGHLGIRELAAAAAERGFHTLAITDHSQSSVIARGLSPQRLEEHIQEIRRVAADLAGRITLLAGSEVDILADGSLDYPNSLLKELDLVVASPHAALSQEPRKATARLLKAMQNPYLTILGHPTGRLVLRREGLAPDMREIAQAAARRGIALEINANSWRLDLRDSHARLALEHGVKLAIDTDAHGLPDLEQLRYGVLTARRAGATRQDVVNCLDRAALSQWISGTRQ